MSKLATWVKGNSHLQVTLVILPLIWVFLSMVGFKELANYFVLFMGVGILGSTIVIDVVFSAIYWVEGQGMINMSIRKIMSFLLACFVCTILLLFMFLLLVIGDKISPLGNPGVNQSQKLFVAILFLLGVFSLYRNKA